LLEVFGLEDDRHPVVNFAHEFVGFFYEARIEQIWSAVASGADSRADIDTGRRWAITRLSVERSWALRALLLAELNFYFLLLWGDNNIRLDRRQVRP